MWVWEKEGQAIVFVVVDVVFWAKYEILCTACYLYQESKGGEKGGRQLLRLPNANVINKSTELKFKLNVPLKINEEL